MAKFLKLQDTDNRAVTINTEKIISFRAEQAEVTYIYCGPDFAVYAKISEESLLVTLNNA